MTLLNFSRYAAVPVWAGVGAIVVGAALLIFGNKKG